MEIVPTDSGLFRSSVEALKEFLPQIQLRIAPDGIRVNGMDVSHVGFIDYFLSKADCDVLKVPSPIVIGLNTTVFAKTLSSVSSGDRITIGMKQDKLLVSYKNERMSKKAVYEISTLDISEEALNLPELTYPATVSAKTADVAAMIKEVGHFGDVILFKLDEHGFHVSAEGDGGNVMQTLENTDDRDMELEEDSMEARYGTKYLTAIMKGGSPLSNSIKLEFDATKPLRTSFHFGKESRFISYLAPKIMDD